MEQIRLIGRLLMGLVVVIAMSAICAVFLLWLQGPIIGDNFIVLAETTPIADRKIFGLFGALPALASWLAALLEVFQVFKRFAIGEIVSSEIVRRLRRFAILSLLTVLLAVLFSGVRRWALGQTGAGGPITHIGIEESQLVLGFMALVVFAVTHGIAEADRYRREMEEYV